MQGEMKTTEQPRVIENIGMLDLTSIKDPADLSNITKIRNVGVILAPKSLMGDLVKISMENTGVVVPIPEASRVRVISGQATLSGDALTQGQDEVLVVMGQLLFTTPVMAGTTRLVVTGQILAPRGSETALAAAIEHILGSVDYYPYSEEGEVRFLNSSSKMQGETLANPTGSEHDILIVNGQLIIASPVERVGYACIFVGGQLVVPRTSQPALDPYLEVNGQVLYYGDTPRFFTQDARFAKEFFELLERPTTLVLVWGDYAIEPDVPRELVQEKVSEIVLGGKLTASSELVPLLQILAVENSGRILVAD